MPCTMQCSSKDVTRRKTVHVQYVFFEKSFCFSSEQYATLCSIYFIMPKNMYQHLTHKANDLLLSTEGLCHGLSLVQMSTWERTLHCHGTRALKQSAPEYFNRALIFFLQYTICLYQGFSALVNCSLSIPNVMRMRFLFAQRQIFSLIDIIPHKSMEFASTEDLSLIQAL